MTIAAPLSHRHVPPAFVLLALPCGLLTGGMALLFIRGRRALDSLPFPPVVRGLVLGALVGLIGLHLPETLTWGEDQIDILANHRAPLDVGASTLLSVAKFGTILLTTASGYGAGIVYPLMMVGYLLGPLGAQFLRPDAWGGQDIRIFSIESAVTDQLFHRDPGVELVGQLLGSGFLAATMRAPLGTAILVSFMSRSATSM